MLSHKRVLRLAGVLVVALLLMAGIMAGLFAPVVTSAAPVAPLSPEWQERPAGSHAPSAGPQPSDALSPGEPPGQVVRRAWERAREAGRYHFVSDITQNLYPAVGLSSAGSGPQRQEVHLEGGIDLIAETMQLKLWQDGGSVMGDAGGAELRVEKGTAYIRRLAGPPGSEMLSAGGWQETPDVSAEFAPGGDALAFLAGMKNVTAGCPEIGGNRDGASSVAYPCYSFDIDGPALARYIRDRLEERLRDQAKLPNGVTLDTPTTYAAMTGQGQLWIDESGLPQRLALHLVLPDARDGSHTEADLRSDFSGFPVPVGPPPIASDPLTWANSVLGVTRHAGDWGESGRWLVALAFGAGSLALLVAGKRLRRLYVAVALAVIFSMVVVPLLQGERAAAFSQETAARQAQQVQQQQQLEEARKQQAEMMGPAWDPNADPLAAASGAAGRSSAADRTAIPVLQSTPTPMPEPDGSNCDPSDTTDRDNDGLNNYDECLRGLDTDSRTGVPDTDYDGLLDGTEIYQLGTLVDRADSDGDYITDTLEVKGYLHLGKLWYLNPLNPDTDGDGLPDSAECGQLLEPSTYPPSTVMGLCDTDGDGTPDPFDLDGDNDGVSDRVDLTPQSWTDRGGLHRSGFSAANLQPYNRANRFALSIAGLQPGSPALVDLQLRPQKFDHVTYALGVLDWPLDTDGQVQHGKNTSLADFSPTADEEARHGDMRLIPLLEIEMNGSSIPLSMTTPSATVVVGSGTPLSTTVTLTRSPANAADTLFNFTLPAASSGMRVYTGTCEALGNSFPQILSGASRTIAGKRVVDLADGNHAAVVLAASGGSNACANLPNVVNGAYLDKMVDQSALAPYGISVREANATRDTTLLMYVPLNVVADDTGGGKTAFQAHILYWPGATNAWSTPQLARVVWVVQALQDQCDASTFYPTLEDYQNSGDSRKEATQDEYDAALRGHCATHRAPDELQVVQTYDENWYLTGLTVREDHGMDVAAIYENPQGSGNGTYPQPENDLWQISLGLNSAFLNQRDCENSTGGASYDPGSGQCSADGKRDLSVARPQGSNATIGGRFDAGIAATYSYTDRWGIPADALRVQTVHLAHQDQAARIATQLVPDILGGLQRYYGTSITPGMLLAREEYYRSAGLEAATWLTGTHVLSLNLADTNNYPEQTLTGINWQPFRYNPSEDRVTRRVIGWESIPTDTAMQMLEEQLTEYFGKIYPEKTDDDHKRNQGRVLVAETYFLTMNQGEGNSTTFCSDMSQCKRPSNKSGPELAKGASSTGKGVTTVTLMLLDELRQLIARGRLLDPSLYKLPMEGISWLKSQARTAPDDFAYWLGNVKASGAFSSYKFLSARTFAIVNAVAAGFIVSAAIVCMSVIIHRGQGDAWTVVTAVVQMTGVLLACVGVIGAIGKLLRALRLRELMGAPLFGFLANGFKNLAGSVDIFKGVMTVVGLVVGVAMNAVSFIVQWKVGGMAAGSLSFDSALASMVVGMVVTLVLFVVFTALGPIGGLIQALLSMIDILVGIICNAAGVTPDKNPYAYKWGCGGITGLLVNFFKMLFYSGALLVDVNANTRLGSRDFDTWLEHPEDGVIEGNTMHFSINLTDTIKFAERPKDSIYAAIEKEDWTNIDNLRKSTFEYVWTLDPNYEPPDKPELGEQRSLWKGTASPIWYTVPVTAGIGVTLEYSGVLHPKIFLAESYAVPMQECWIGHGCDIKAERKTTLYDMSNGVNFDVFPKTVHDFRSLARTGGGARLAWGGNHGLNFPMLYDADNDGLPATSDADDTKADRDGDGLLDSFEVETGSDPALVDTDGDGLNDAGEARAGTNPRLADRDGDGLTDKQELDGWEVVYGVTNGVAQKTWVRSDPLQPDADGDGLMDSKEKVYGFNPNVPNSVNVLSLSSGLSEGSGGASDGFVAPGQTLYYTATVVNELNNRWAQGLLQATTQPGLTAGTIGPQEFVLWPKGTTTTAGSLTVAPSASGLYTVTETAGALITDWAEPAHGARLWLPFDDVAHLLGDRSASLPPHDAACVSVWGYPATDCDLETNGQFGNAIKLKGYSYVRSTAGAPATGYAVSLWFKTTTAGPLFYGENASLSNPQAQVWLDDGLLNAGVRYSGSPSGYDWVTAAGNWLDGKWHHLVQTVGYGAPGTNLDRRQKLYVDGVFAGTGLATSLPEAIAFSYIGGSKHLTYGLSASFDDVRVFDHQLSQDDARELFDQPILSLNFDDQSNLLKDTSPFAMPVANPTVYPEEGGGPVRSVGLVGDGAQFYGKSWASAQSAALNLNGGQLTLAAWVYPQNQNKALYDGWAQGIVGYHSEEPDGYPTLQRVGNQVRFGFAGVTPTTPAWRSFTSAPVLTLNAWNHVAVTYDQRNHTARLYVNGRLREQNSQAFADVSGLVPPTNPPRLDIGRSNDLTTLTLRYMNVVDNGTYRGNNPAHWCFALDQQRQLASLSDIWAGHFEPMKTLSFRTSTEVAMWRDRATPTCGANPNDNDNKAQLNRGSGPVWRVPFYSYEAGDRSWIKAYYDFEQYNYQPWFGSVSFQLSNTSIPFYGRLDDVRIYNQALDGKRVDRLYKETALALQLLLDDPPGTRAFAEASAVRREVGCTSCPTAGLPGRVNQAATFNGTGNYLHLPNSAVNQIGSELTVAAWIKPDSVSGSQRIVSTANTKSTNGWGLGLSGTKLWFTTFGVQDYLTAGLPLPTGRWSHVAAVMDASHGVAFYLNGSPAGSVVPGTGPARPDTDDELMIGGMTWGSSGPAQLFHGMIDDLHVYLQALPAAQVQAVYDEAPAMHLRFNEARGATSFADGARDGVYATCVQPGCPSTGDGIDGQFGPAAAFDGKEDVVTVPAATTLDRAAWTVGAWVKPNGSLGTPQPLVSKGSGSTTNYRLSIDTNSLVPRLEACGAYITSTVPLVQGQWNHLIGTYDGNKLRIFVNGSEGNPSPRVVTGSCTAPAPVYIGGDAAGYRLAGALDEVVLYPSVLQPWDIHDLFTYQNGWVEDRRSQSVVVDNDSPTAHVLLPSDNPTYLPLRDTQIPITANDQASGVADASLCYLETHTCGAPAPRCSDGNPDAWCPTYRPVAEGEFGLYALAGDLVGHRSTNVDTRAVRIDDTPPQVTFSTAAGQRLDTVPDPTRRSGWRIRLTGTAVDTGIPGGLPGSGVPADGVRVTVLDANGGLAGPRRQAATLDENAWWVDYPLIDSRPAGCYMVAVEASDALASLPGLSADQVARHRTTITTTVSINSSAPSVQMDRSWLSTRSMISGTAQLNGVATSRPTNVRVDWTTGPGGAGAAVSLVCMAPEMSTTYTPYALPAGRLAANSKYSWAGEIQRTMSCEFHVLAPAGSQAVLEGTTSVCGHLVNSWSDNGAAHQTVSFAANASTCVPDACIGTLATAGVGRVDVAYTPLLPGFAFRDEPAPPGEVLHLSFDEGAGSAGPFRDVSGGGYDATCSGATCPSPARAGHAGGAVSFDGVDDRVLLPNFGTLSHATVSAWVKRTGNTSWRESIVSYKEVGYCGFVLSLNENRIGQSPRFFVRVQPATGAAYWTYAEATSPVPLNRWVNLVGTYDGAIIRLYQNGQLVASTPAAGEMAQCTYSSSTSAVGSQSTGSNHYFPGLIDEVRVFDGALTDADVKALYLGSGPLLELDFEDSPATDGAPVADSSGWHHHGELHAGTGDTANKAVAGQVGRNALSLDGIDDYVGLGDINQAEGFGDFTLSQWFSVDALGAAGSGQDWAAPAGKGAWNSTDGWAVLVNRDSGNTGKHSVWLYLNGATVAGIPAPAGGWLVGRWYHYALTRRGNTVRGYLDGIEKVSVTNSTVPMANDAELLLGRNSSTSAPYWWRGSLDDLSIYARALTAEEVQELHTAGWQQTALNPAGGATVRGTRWSTTLPAGLEGAYRVDLRTWDGAAIPHVEMAPAGSSAARATATWSTDIDTLAPRVTLCRSGTTGAYIYTALARDFNLIDGGFSSPCGAGVITARDYFDSPWFVAGVPPGTRRLYGLVATCTLAALPPTEQTRACDSAGNCATSSGFTTGPACQALAAASPATLQSQQAEDSLRAAEVPAAAAGKPRRPAIAFVPQTYTTTNLYPPRTLELSGIVTGTERVTGVEVAAGGASGAALLFDPALTYPFTRTWSYSWELPDGALPDGLVQTAVATATVQASHGHETSTHQTLMIDVVPPAPVTLTLTSNGKPVLPGATLRSGLPTLTLGWNASHDGSGVGGYLARWMATSQETTTQSIRWYGPGEGREDAYAAGEAERLHIELASQDQYGNRRWQDFGNVYADHPTTPDYIALGEYDGWMDSGCSLLGTDPRSERRNPNQRGRPEQHLYGTWDRHALRLAWTGANWNGQGDLFVYLDTGPGGTGRIFTPFPKPAGGAAITLPVSMDADFLVWVHSSDEATLLSSANGGWTPLVTLGRDEFRFDASRRAGQTDLYLPFAQLGLSAASQLSLLAFATEEPAEGRPLELWATLPLANPVNSPHVSLWAGLVSESVGFSLFRAHSWTALGDGVCPAGAPPSDLEVTISADPAGASLSGIGNGLFWLADPAPLLAMLGDINFGLLPALHPPVRNGQVIQYTAHYVNRGDQVAENVRLKLSTVGQIRLPEDQPADLGLGDIPPGGEGEASFRAVADRSAGHLSNLLAGGVKAMVYDAASGDGPALEWIWVAHRIDQGTPNSGRVDLPSRIGPGALHLIGVASDAAGVHHVTVEVQGPDGINPVSCPVGRPLDGGWSCDWTPDSAMPDGTQVTVRVQAANVFGEVGAWSEPQSAVVDARPPDLAFTAEASGVRPGGIVGSHSPTVIGTAADPGGVASVRVCVVGEDCGHAHLQQGASQSMTSTWTYQTPDLGALDYVSRTVKVSAMDGVGNATTEPLVLSGHVDNVPPLLKASQVLSGVVLGRTSTVLRGTVADGSEAAGGLVVNVSVRVQPSQGDPVREDTIRDGETWRYDLTRVVPGYYTLWVDADDAAGNRSSEGPFAVIVTCADAAIAVVALTAEPSPAGSNWLTIKPVIRNGGPDGIPAGLPFVMYAPAQPSGQVTATKGFVHAIVTTTLALSAGETETLNLDWATDAIGFANVMVAPAGEGVAYAGEVALCTRPETRGFAGVLANVKLAPGWNLISPPVEPFEKSVAIVQRPISGTYDAIIGYKNGPEVFDLQRPAASTLTSIQAGRGYWVRLLGDGITSLRMIGTTTVEDRRLALVAGWNLVGYLPHASLPVTAALGSINRAYASVMGFDGTALSYYPDLDARYNTLAFMVPSTGYWISATHAITLAYPSTLSTTLPITGTPTLSQTLALYDRLATTRAAEQAAGVRPGYSWANLYGNVYLPDGSPASTGTRITALANGVACGATIVVDEGQFGLLACYGDDATTPGQVDGARRGDLITFLVNGVPATARAIDFAGVPVPPGQAIQWTAHGDRWQVAVGAEPLVDVAVGKSVSPALAVPGAPVTFTLAYTNVGNRIANGVVLTDLLPLEIDAIAFTPGGVRVPVPGGGHIRWSLGDLAPGANRVVTVTGVVNPALMAQLTITNTAVITAVGDAQQVNNLSEAAVQVNLVPDLVVLPATQGVQYSDLLAAVAVSARDAAGDELALATAWRGPGSGPTPGLPPGLALGEPVCEEAGGQRHCAWALGGAAEGRAGIYTITLTVSDQHGSSAQADTSLVVAAENAVLALAATNPSTVTVPASSDRSGPFSLTVTAREFTPDLGASPAPGAISMAALSIGLEPAVAGQPLPVACDPYAVAGTGYEAVVALTCVFAGLPLGSYTVRAEARGGFYTGTAQAMLNVVSDPMAPRAWLPLVMH